MSPFFFAIVLEHLSRNLNGPKTAKKFKYHPRCAKLRITYLSFADDLLLFTRGDMKSVQAIQQKFLLFPHVSGLYANLSKSEVYIGGVPS